MSRQALRLLNAARVRALGGAQQHLCITDAVLLIGRTPPFQWHAAAPPVACATGGAFHGGFRHSQGPGLYSTAGSQVLPDLAPRRAKSSQHASLAYARQLHVGLAANASEEGTARGKAQTVEVQKVLDSAENAGWTYAETVNLPNALTLSRALSGPVIALWITQA